MPSAVKPPQTLYDKVFEHHIVTEKDDGTILLYIGASLAVGTETTADGLQTDIWSTK
jgi:homoaconitase/3-isopropylmalate dehydratase large subunit